MRVVKYLVAIGAVLALLGWGSAVSAQSFRSGDNVVVSQNEILDQSLFTSGKTLDIAGTINGDVYCAGQNITITATVNGDVICAGQSVSVSGRVTGDVRLAGQNITLSGQVGDNASVVGQSFTLDSQAKIGRDLSVAVQDAILNGPVGRDIAGAGAAITVNGSVGHNIQAQVEKLSLGSNAKVNGSIDYTSRQMLSRDQTATVTGPITRTEPKNNMHANAGSMAALKLGTALYIFVSLLAICLVLVLLFPRIFHTAIELARPRLLMTFLVGLVASIVVPFILLFLMFTIIGIPLAIFGWLVWLVLILLSGPFASYLLGRLLLQGSTNNAIWTMLLGAAVLLLLYFIPILGILTSLVAMWFGLGVILMRVTNLPRPRYELAPATAKGTGTKRRR